MNLVEPTDDEWRFVKGHGGELGIDRGWNAAYQSVSTSDVPGQEPPADGTPHGP